jgi:hypothetical protein
MTVSKEGCCKGGQGSQRVVAPDKKNIYMQGDSKLLSWFPFMVHGIPDNNLKSLCIYRRI